MVGIQYAELFSKVDSELLKRTFVTLGTAPNFQLQIDGISSYDALQSKSFRIKLHSPMILNQINTLNINSLGAVSIQISQQNSEINFQTAIGYVMTLTYIDGKFILNDNGALSPMDVNNEQSITGIKTFANQIISTSNNSIGIQTPSGYMYTKQVSGSSDSIGDIRINASSPQSGLVIQACTASSASKGTGEWSTIDAYAPSAVFNKTGINQTVANGTTFNLMSLLTNADGTYKNSSASDWSLVSGVLKFPALDRRVNYNIRISISGSFAGGSPSATRTISLTFERANGTLMIGGSNSIVTSDTLTRTTQLTTSTFTETKTDSFSVTGTIANILHNTNQNLNITGVQIAIFGSRV